MSNIFSEQICSKKISISPSELNNNKDIDALICDKIKNSIGNRCINEGYVDKDTIKIIRRSIGKINAIHFNGNINYNVEYVANICNPYKNMKINNCEVKNINKMGIMAINKPLNIVIARQHHEDQEGFDEIKIGDKISIIIIGLRYELNDKEITVVGKLV